MKEQNIDDIINDLFSAVDERIRGLNKLNLIVVGRSGAGKSTLINAVFRENFAKTGVGKPVTDEIRNYSKPNYPLSLYDTPGFEMNEQQRENVINGIEKIISDGFRFNDGDPSKIIHCIWYCINPNLSRIDPEEEKWLRNLSDDKVAQKVPIIIVLTQGSIKSKVKEIETEIKQLNLNIANIVPVLANDQQIDEEYIARSYGLETLIKTTFNVLPDYLHETLNNIQKVSLDMKVSSSRKAVIAAISAAAVTAASPIPFSDAFLLVPTQITMIATITSIFGIDISKAAIASLLSSAIGTTVTTLAGKQFVTSLIKLIPGLGTVIGGTISAATAGTLTYALGEAYIQLMILLYEGKISNEDLVLEKGRQLFIEYFKEQSKKELPINISK